MVFELKGLSYAYGPHPALNDISLTLASGRFYAVIGPNGCGKTTLVDLLCGYKAPAAGAIKYQGHSMASYGKRRLAREIALVPQEYWVNFPYAAREMVMMGRYPHMSRFSAPSAADMAYIDRILDICDARYLSNRYMTELSGGEKQRVVFARALVQDTPVLLLDEPCANLDIKHALHLLDLAADRVKRQCATVVAVMHDINLAVRYADALVLMKSGRVAATGNTSDVLTAATLRDIFDVEARIFKEPYLNVPQVMFLK
ncbi:MAG: ABC transporter ATP-binding protein [Desulfobacterales bacterium]